MLGREVFGNVGGGRHDPNWTKGDPATLDVARVQFAIPPFLTGNPGPSAC